MKSILCILGCISLWGCKEKEPFEGFIGRWLRDRGEYLERWERTGEGQYQAKAFRIVQGDTLLLESVDIYRQGPGWVYAVTAAGPDSATVRFTSVAIGPASATFANPQHDFPQVISYTLNAPDRLNAYIAAGADTVRFNFTRQ